MSEHTLPNHENVWDYPRPPSVVPFEGLIEVKHNGLIIAKSTHCLRVLETFHPPVYFIHESDVETQCLFKRVRDSVCPWKGRIKFFDIVASGAKAEYAAWNIPNPAQGYEILANYYAFFAHKVDECWVNDERVIPQPGEFYGGWITSNISGPFKGLPGTDNW